MIAASTAAQLLIVSGAAGGCDPRVTSLAATLALDSGSVAEPPRIA